MSRVNESQYYTERILNLKQGRIMNWNIVYNGNICIIVASALDLDNNMPLDKCT